MKKRGPTFEICFQCYDHPLASLDFVGAGNRYAFTQHTSRHRRFNTGVLDITEIDIEKLKSSPTTDLNKDIGNGLWKIRQMTDIFFCKKRIKCGGHEIRKIQNVLRILAVLELDFCKQF